MQPSGLLIAIETSSSFRTWFCQTTPSRGLPPAYLPRLFFSTTFRALGLSHIKLLVLVPKCKAPGLARGIPTMPPTSSESLLPFLPVWAWASPSGTRLSVSNTRSRNTDCDCEGSRPRSPDYFWTTLPFPAPQQPVPSSQASLSASTAPFTSLQTWLPETTPCKISPRRLLLRLHLQGS